MICTQTCFAYENLLISGLDTVAQIKNHTPEIISVETLTTIMNTRDTVLVEAKKEGNGEFTLVFETGKTANIKLKITKEQTQVTTKKSFDIFVIDDYAKEVEIDLPPGVIVE